MPKIVACPKCQKQYKLPDTFTAKRVRCKACSTEFSTEQVRKPAAQTPAKPKPRPKPQPKPQPNPEASRRNALSSMGLSELKQQPDFFGDQTQGGPDPLRNHVVQDPGFSLDQPPAQGAPSNNPGGGIEDVVANPYMSGAGASSSSAARNRALKRKKEDKLLSAYQTDDVGPAARSGSNIAETGINRLAFWLGLGAYSSTIKLINRVAEYAAPPPAATAGQAPASAEVQILAVLGAVLFIAVSGAYLAVIMNMRYVNMKLKSQVWKTIATMTVVVPAVCFAVALLLLVPQVPALAIAAIILFLIGAVTFLAFIPFAWAGHVLPPDFGIHRKFDFWSWFWIVILTLPVIGIFVIFAIVMMSRFA